jgi:hypothetical protein
MPAPLYKGRDALIEQVGSGKLTRGKDGVTLTKIYRGKREHCEADSPANGTFGTGLLAGFRVRQSVVEPQLVGMAVLTIDWEASGDSSGEPGSPAVGNNLPADTFTFDPEEVNPSAEKNPAFRLIRSDLMIRIHDAVNSPDEGKRAEQQSYIYSLPPGDPDRGDEYVAAGELLDLLLAGDSTYYLASARYSWTQHYWGTQPVDMGGVIETPGGPLADNLPAGFDWLRLADRQSEDGGVCALTKTWLGGPGGHWNGVLYPSR